MMFNTFMRAERYLGKGEAVGSIHTGSTISQRLMRNQRVDRHDGEQ